jgi:phage terminase small subunit
LTKKLTAKQARFVEEYLIDLNATQAAIRAGYSAKTAHSIGDENLRKPAIQAALQAAMDKRSERTEITQDRVLQEYARIAFVDPRKFFDEEGKLIPISDLDEDTARALAGMDYHAEWETSKEDKETMGSTTKIKLIDKKGALDSVGKHLGMFIERKEVGEPGAFEKYDNQQLETLIAARTARIGSGNTGIGKAEGEPKSNPVRRLH